MNKENKDNIPEDCRHCANDKDCYTYYGSNVCQNHWLKREINDENKWVMENIMELSQEEKDKLYELIDKLNPCVSMGSKETIERFKEWTEGKVKNFEILDNDNFLCEDQIYLIPIEPPNKPIRVFIEGE